MPVLNTENCKQTAGFGELSYAHFCLPLCWQNGCSFNSGVLVSWSEEWGDESPEHWVQPMPTRAELHGFDPVTRNTRRTCNPVPLETLSMDAQKWHEEQGHVITVKASDLFGWVWDTSGKNAEGHLSGQVYGDGYAHKWGANDQVRAVANYGRGPVLESMNPGVHEKEQQDIMSLEWSGRSWLTL